MSHTYMPVSLDRKSTAKAMGKDLAVSPKVAIEISNFLRGREVNDAMKILNRVMEKQQAIPYKRFGSTAGHKPGHMAAGRYPIKASAEFLKLLKNAKANASSQGLSGTLRITHIAVQRANEPYRNRAKERITFKRAHIEIILVEDRSEKKMTSAERHAQKHGAAKQAAKPKETKQESKPEAKVAA
jgi:large subunit ribosomal protein L22